MILGALVDAGVDPQLLQRTVAALNVGAELRIGRVDRSGISSTKLDVLMNGQSAETASQDGPAEHDHQHAHEHARSRDHRNNSHSGNGDHHHHEHEHDHPHGRSLSVIREIIRNADLPQSARETAIRAFELLGEAEAKIHNVPIESIHFHEVGAVDAIVDIVCSAVGCHALGVDEFVCSPLNVGGGTVKCAHGEFPIPAPATLALLKGAPLYSSGVSAELVTPTGAAIIRALGCRFSAFPAMNVDSIGYGAGSRNIKGHANVLRISVGELIDAAQPKRVEDTQYEVTVLETTIDDLSPQVMGYVTERLLAEGALDVFIIPAQMKKNRPGSLLTVLCDENKAPNMRSILFRETSTIGIRTRRERRDCLERTLVPSLTQWGMVRVKESRLNGAVTNFAPEYEDCRSIAEANSLPLKQVQQEAIAAYLAQRTSSTPETSRAAENSKPSGKSQVA